MTYPSTGKFQCFKGGAAAPALDMGSGACDGDVLAALAALLGAGSAPDSGSVSGKLRRREPVLTPSAPVVWRPALRSRVAEQIVRGTA